MDTSGAVIVSWDFSNGKDVGVLLVGKKEPGKAAEIINAFQGKEAEELYLRLMTRKDAQK